MQLIKPYLILFIFLLATTNNLYGQIEKEHLITLEPSALLSKVNFTCGEVIDARRDKTKIGVVRKGLSSEKYNANLNGDFSITLKIALSKIMPPQKDKTPLVFIIHQLKITELNTGGQPYGYSKAVIEIAKTSDSLLYSLGIFEHEVYRQVLDPTHTHHLRIIKVIKKCIKKLVL